MKQLLSVNKCLGEQGDEIQRRGNLGGEGCAQDNLLHGECYDIWAVYPSKPVGYSIPQSFSDWAVEKEMLDGVHLGTKQALVRGGNLDDVQVSSAGNKAMKNLIL